ncbi:MAG: S41 family peptidase [Clostridia bacterium]|nr:S41 family peptidase [Clostridia bacterium]
MSDRRRVLIAIVVLMFLFGATVSGVLVTNYQHIGTLVKVVKLVRNNYIEPVTTTQLMDGAIKGIVESLDDPYSVYLEPKRYQELQVQMQGSFGGLGIHVGVKDKHITVIAPIKGTPAFRAGVKAGDVIARINDQDAINMDIDKAVELMRGPAGTRVKITVIREEKGEKKPLEFNIVREIITVPSVEGKLVKGEPIAHIQLSMFNENTKTELAETIKKLEQEKFRGIILDLRNNPGGELKAAGDVANYFVPKGRIVTIRDRFGAVETIDADGDKLNYPLVVLVNGFSASASEIVAGAIKDTGSGTLVGTKTYGKGVVQTIFKLDSDSGLKITTAKYFTPKGHDIHKKGIDPDVVIEQPEDSKEDLQLNKAVEILKSKIQPQ